MSGTYGPCHTPFRSGRCAAAEPAHANASTAAAIVRRNVVNRASHTKPIVSSHIIRPDRPRRHLTLHWWSYENDVAWTAGKSGLRTHLGVEDVCMKTKL